MTSSTIDAVIAAPPSSTSSPPSATASIRICPTREHITHPLAHQRRNGCRRTAAAGPNGDLPGHDLDPEQCLVFLREKDGTRPESPRN